MFRLLSRYFLSELLRTIGLTAAVLVTVIAFGATVKPLAAGLLAPGDVLKYVLFAVVPMLQFALPFAAGFGATVVFHRLAADNEILAAAVGGLSYRRILTPVLGLGLILVLAMLLLVHAIIPRFWLQLQRTVTQDASRLFVAALERGEAFRMKDIQIYADEYYLIDENLPSGAQTRLQLEGVAAAQLDAQGRIEKDVTARAAVADFHRVDGDTLLKITLLDVVGYDAAGGTLAHAERADPRVVALPDPFRENPKYMTLGHLLRLRANPDDYRTVVEAREALAARLGALRLRDRLAADLASDGEVAFDAGELTHVLRARSIEGASVRPPPGEPVTVFSFRGEDLVREFQATSGRLTLLEPDLLDDDPRFTLTLEDVTVTDRVHRTPPFRQPRAVLEGLVPPPATGPPLRTLGSEALLALAAERTADPAVADAVDDLEYERAELRWEIDGRIGQRNALAATSLLLLLLGALLAMHLRDSQPLTIYLWAFLPAIVTIFLTSGGEQTIRDGRVLTGTLVMWSGHAGLLLLILVVYRRLARH